MWYQTCGKIENALQEFYEMLMVLTNGRHLNERFLRTCETFNLKFAPVLFDDCQALKGPLKLGDHLALPLPSGCIL